jgi:hypothetical protein
MYASEELQVGLGGWRYRRAAAQAAGVSPASR